MKQAIADQYWRSAAALLVVVLGACSVQTRYPITQQAQPFLEMNPSSPGVAPNVTANVTSERIVRARTEPQNWLTFYGAYGAPRGTALFVFALP